MADSVFYDLAETPEEAANLTAAQAHILVGEILEKFVLKGRTNVSGVGR